MRTERELAPIQQWSHLRLQVRVQGHLDGGPGLLRFDDRVNWLRDEYGLAHGHATAIVHEHDLKKAHRSFE